MVFEVGIGTSQNWNPEEAAKEVISQALAKLTKPPTFVLLFSTIHHEKNKGFQKILDTIYTQIPKETPLVGGTVAGFMNPSGCYTQGLTALACNSDEIEVATGIGHNTKRNPKKAGEECARQIKKTVMKNQNSNKFILELISGPIIPRIPLIKIKNVDDSFLAGLFSRFSNISGIIGTGIDGADISIETLSYEFKDYYIMGAALEDDGKLIKNFQFINSKINTNSTVGLKLTTNRPIDLTSFMGIIPTGKKATITKLDSTKRTIFQINNQPAKEGYLNLIGLSKENIRIGSRLYKQLFYYPLTYNEESYEIPHLPGFIWKNAVGFGNQFKNNQVALYHLSTKKIMQNVNNLNISNKPLTFGIFCETYLETMGRGVYKISDIIKNKVGNNFLIIFSAGESIFKPGEKIGVHLYETGNVLQIY